MTFLIFLFIGASILWLGGKATDDIPLIAASLSGLIMLIWGFAMAPLPFQLLVEVGLVGAAFSMCVRCCNCDNVPSQRSQ
jgi:hypothetical protein